jgi:hypothetical protein
MNWKEQLNDRLPMILDKRGMTNLTNFISTEIIEKLIEDIQIDHDMNMATKNVLANLKRELRDKWL